MNHLILLPGMMCDERLFVPQMAHLSPRFDICVPPIDGHSTMANLAESVLASAPARFALGGLSMGGILAMEIMRQAGDRVTHLALMDTNPFAETDVVKTRRQPQMEKVMSGKLAAVMRDEMKPNYLADGPDRARLLDLCLEMALDVGPDAFINQSKALRDRPDYTEILSQVSCPVLLLCGAEDKLCPPERHHAMLTMMPHARLQIIAEAGHMPTLEQPHMVNNAVTQLLELENEK